MKLLVQLRPLIILFFVTSLSGQSLTAIQEYKAVNDLLDAIVVSDTNSIKPRLFIYANHFADAQTGKTVSDISARQSFVLSEHNQLLGLFSPEKSPSNRTEPREFEFTVYSLKNKMDFIIHDKYIDTGKRPAFFLNEAKNAALQVSPNGDRIKFYDNHGRFLRQKTFSQNLAHNYETALIAFNAEGNRIAFYTRIFDMENNQMIPMLYLLSPIGEEIRKVRLILKRIDALTISESGQTIAVAGQTYQPVGSQAQNQIFVFNSAGVIQNSLPYRAIDMTFNQSENQLLIREEQTVKIIDLHSEGIVISKQAGRGRREIADMSFLNDSTFILSLGIVKFHNDKRIYDSPEIQLYSTDGNLIAGTEFHNTYSHHAKIFTSISGSQMGICLQNKFFVLQLTQKD